MKLTLAVLSWCWTAVVAARDDEAQHSAAARKLRHHQHQQQKQPAYGGHLDEVIVEGSTCNDQPDKDSCWQATDDDSGASCEWCVAGAVPSECVSPDQAQMLPPAVFDCTSPSSAAMDTEEEEEATNNGKTFNFVKNQVHTLKAAGGNDDGPAVNDLCDASSKSLSGYMDIKGSSYDEKGEGKHLFYWMFEKRGDDIDDNTPFLVWLTGGPGCSSTLALLTENGPCSVNKDGKSTSVNPYSWSEAAHVLWLDQPAGVGFSYGEETDTNEQMVAEDAYYFLQAFFQTYPQFSKSPLFIVGESYGGHYAPAIAHRVWKGNQEGKPKTISLNLSGLGIGNGLTNPEEQYKWYPEMGHNNSHGIKIFPDDVYQGMLNVVPKCTSLIHKCNEGDSVLNQFACQSAFVLCNTGLTSPYQATGLNPYDIRIPCAKPPLCYDFGHVAKWLRDEDTLQRLGVDEKHSHRWESCNFGINMKFHSDWMHDFSPYVADLLNAGIPALIYAGDVDFICNYLGNQAWTLKLPWKGHDDFVAAKPHEWGNKAGLARTAGGLTFLQVYDAGHMVPSDKPEVSLDMIRNFMNGGAF